MKFNFESDIKTCIEVLRNGGIILYPTDTVWGIGCDATNQQAVEKIFKIKQRADSKSMLVLTDSMAKLQVYVEEIPDMAWDLTELSEKPLTIIYPDARNLASGLIADDGSVGIRISNEAFSKSLCQRFRKPIVSTSANISGQPTPQTFSTINDEIKNAVDYVVQYRQDDTTVSKPSSIIKLDKGNVIRVIRE